MTRLTWLVLGGVSVLLGSAAMIGGCGSDDATIPDADSGASSSGSSGSSGSPGDATAEGSPGTDASTDAAKDGGADAADAGELTTNPGQISCGKTSCTVGTETCCRGLNDAGCQPVVGGTCFGGANLACDEKADCTGTDVCCSQGLATACKGPLACAGLMDYQICKTNAECPKGTCYINKCGFGMNVTIIPSCTAIAQCTQ